MVNEEHLTKLVSISFLFSELAYQKETKQFGDKVEVKQYTQYTF